MGISVGGLASGIDTQSIIDSLVSIEQEKVTKVENEKSQDQVKISALSKVQSLLSTLQDKIQDLSKTDSFDLFKTSSSDDDAVTIKGSSGATDSQYDVKTYQLATNEKMISTNGKITNQTASLSSMGISAGTISINGVEITIDDDDTIQDLRSKINSATDSDGDKIGVTASVVESSDNNFRLVISAKDSGSAGIEYKDVSGTTLEDLGIITDASGSKGNVSQVVQSADSISSAFDNNDVLAEGDVIQINGTDHDGNKVSFYYTKTSDSSTDDFLSKVDDAFHGTVDASFDSSGKLVLKDKVSGTSDLSISTLKVSDTEHTTKVSTVGKEGKGVLSTGKDAYFSIDDINMSNSSNSVDKAITGVTFDLKSVSTDAVTVSLDRDTDAIKQKIQAVIDAYNTLQSDVNTETKYADPNTDGSTNGDLAGDSTVKNILSEVSNAIKNSYDMSGSTSKFGTLTMFGLETNSQTGQLSLNSDTFNNAVKTNYDDLVSLFTSSGLSNNTGVTMGRNTKDTQSGVYELEEVDSEHVKIRLSGSSDWYTSDTRNGDIITFSDGPAKGLSITAPAGAIGTSGTTFTFSKGLGATLDEMVDGFNNSSDGIITMREQSLQTDMKDKSDRIDELNTRIDDYRTRLTKQYTAMEESLSDLKSQTSNLISSLSSSS